MSNNWCEFDEAVAVLARAENDAVCLWLAHRVLDLLAKLPHCHGPSYDWRSKMLEFGTPNYPAGIIYEGELPEVTLAAVTCAEFITWRETQ